MGCSSDLGCLGPRQRQREVYVDLIQAIYKETEQMPLPADEDLYEYIKNRLMKKGLLRKLTDNLRSHKNNVYECVNQNFQIISQTKLASYRVTSLIVVDKIMEELLKIHRSQQDSGIYQRHSIELPLHSTKHYLDFHGSNSSFLQFDQRIDNIFFKQIILLLETEKQLEERIINSVIQFSEHKQDKVVNKSQVYLLLEYAFRKINKKHEYASGFRAFELLIKRLKENLKDEEKDQKYIKCFLGFAAKNDLEINKEVKGNCSEILKAYFSKYFSDYSIIYRSMVELFDDFFFASARIWSVWELMVRISKEQDNYSNFIRGIFIYLLRYIMVHEQLSSHSKMIYKLEEFNPKIFKNIFKEQCKLNAFKMVTQWIINKDIDIDQTIVYSSSLIVMTYITNFVYGSNEGIKQELKKEFYKIIELLNVKSNEIIISLLIQEMKERQTLNKKRKMLLVVIKEIIVLKKMLSSSQITEFTNIFMCIEPHYSLEIKLEIINYMKFVLKSVKSEYINGASYDSVNLRQKLCDFVFSLYTSIISEEEFQEETENYIKTNLLRRSRNIDELTQSKGHILQKNKFCAELILIIKILLEQHFYIIVVSFIQNINDAMPKLNELENEEEAYIIIFFLQFVKRHALFSINKRQKLPEEMLKAHLKLEEGYITNATRADLISLSLKIIKQCEMDFPREENQQYQNSFYLKDRLTILMKSDNRRISSAKEFYMFNQLEYGQVMQNFKHHFRLSSVSTKKEMGESLNEGRFFHRHSSMNLSRQEFERQRESVRHQADESFRDIITKINQR